jgi:hypothetical protein
MMTMEMAGRSELFVDSCCIASTASNCVRSLRYNKRSTIVITSKQLTIDLYNKRLTIDRLRRRTKSID